MLLVWLLFSVFTITLARPNHLDLKNVITVPPNCPVGQELINGQCRDVWRRFLSSPAPSIYAREIDSDVVKVVDQNEDISTKNIISVPSQCPDGYRPDALGYCRKIFES